MSKNQLRVAYAMIVIIAFFVAIIYTFYNLFYAVDVSGFK